MPFSHRRKDPTNGNLIDLVDSSDPASFISLLEVAHRLMPELRIVFDMLRVNSGARAAS